MNEQELRFAKLQAHVLSLANANKKIIDLLNEYMLLVHPFLKEGTYDNYLEHYQLNLNLVKSQLDGIAKELRRTLPS